MTDVVVVVPGILGSNLSHHGTPVWSPTPGSVLRTIRTFGGSLQALTLPAGIGDEDPDDGVEATALMPDLHLIPGLWTPIKGYDRLVTRLTRLGYRRSSPDPAAPPGNLLLFPYDWRLSNRYTARKLKHEAERVLGRWRDQGGEHTDAQLVFVTHSMGGLVARRYIECEGGATHTRKLVSLGTPYRGAASAVEQLVNGVRKGLGPFGVDLTKFARSLPSLHQLLPEYACIDTGEGELLRTTDTGLPEVDTPMLADAAAFHAEINDAAAARDRSNDVLHAILGARQLTTTTIRIVSGRAVPLPTYRDSSGSQNDYGDATVPAAGGTPYGLSLNTNLVRHVVDNHGNLQRNKAALDEVEQAVTARAVIPKAPVADAIRAQVPDLLVHGEPLTVEADIESDDHHGITITTITEAGRTVDARSPRVRDGHITTTITGLDPGAYTITVEGIDGALPPVTTTVLVWPAI